MSERAFQRGCDARQFIAPVRILRPRRLSDGRSLGARRAMLSGST